MCRSVNFIDFFSFRAYFSKISFIFAPLKTCGKCRQRSCHRNATHDMVITKHGL
jgi:hypothetical protein